jgi:hypothetical protein
MALNVGLDASFDNMKNYKGVEYEGKEELIVRTVGLPAEFSTAVKLVLLK